MHTQGATYAVIHVQVEHRMVEILAGVGARVYYSKDGSTAADTAEMERYLGPFTLRPGVWQLVAIAKHTGKVDRSALSST